MIAEHTLSLKFLITGRPFIISQCPNKITYSAVECQSYSMIAFSDWHRVVTPLHYWFLKFHATSSALICCCAPIGYRLVLYSDWFESQIDIWYIIGLLYISFIESFCYWFRWISYILKIYFSLLYASSARWYLFHMLKIHPSIHYVYINTFCRSRSSSALFSPWT